MKPDQHSELLIHLAKDHFLRDAACMASASSRRPRLTTLLATALLAATNMTTALAEPSQYLCISDKDTGMHYVGELTKWVPQIFEANDKYIMRPLNADDWKHWGELIESMSYALKIKPGLEPVWGFFDFDGTYLESICNIHWACQSVLGSLLIDKATLRFSLALQNGYVTQGKVQLLQHENHQLNLPKGYDPSRPGDDVLMIGNCSPF